MDWPLQPGALLPHNTVSTVSAHAPLSFMPAGLGIGAVGWPVANRAIFVPVRLGGPFTVARMYWFIGNGSANIDAGVYDAAGTRLASTGTVVGAGINVIQSAAVTTAARLAPGLYYLALNLSATSTTVGRGSPPAQAYLTAMGCAQQDVGSVTLPATATFASLASLYYPIFGMSARSLP